MRRDTTATKNIPFEQTASIRLPRKVQLNRINRVIREELTELQRETILAYYFQEQSIVEIAKTRGVNKGTVCRTLHRAEEKLKRYLKY